MQVNYDTYIRNVRMFYQQLVKGHNEEERLIKLFKQMLENETRKWKKGFSIRGPSERGGEGAGLLAKLREQQKGGKEKQKINVEVLFASSNVENMVVFGYCYLLLQYKNAEALQLLMHGAEKPLSDHQTFTQMMLRKVHTLYQKMDQVVSGRRKIVRFQRQLMEGFKDLPQSVIDIFYKTIVHDQLIKTDNVPAYLEQISKKLKIKVEYFQINDNDNIKLSAYGAENAISMRFGMFVKEKIFGYVSKLPEKQNVQINKEVTLTKFLQVSEALNKMYSENMKEYMGLNNLKVGKLVRSDSMSSTGSINMGNSKLRKIQSNSSQFASI